jgi:hypothetical protein
MTAMQQLLEPVEQEREVVACGGVAAHAVLGLDVADHGLDRRASSHSRLMAGVTRRF